MKLITSWHISHFSLRSGEICHDASWPVSKQEFWPTLLRESTDKCWQVFRLIKSSASLSVPWSLLMDTLEWHQLARSGLSECLPPLMTICLRAERMPRPASPLRLHTVTRLRTSFSSTASENCRGADTVLVCLTHDNRERTTTHQRAL